MTEILLLIGVVTAVVFIAVLLVEGAIRPGYDPVYHTGSELSLVIVVGFRSPISFE